VNWEYLRLEEVQASKRWAFVGGPFGSKLTRRDYVERGIPVIRGTNLSGDTRFNYGDFVFVSEDKADKLISNNAHPGDVIFTQRGTLGQVGIIPRNSPYPRYVISQSQMKLTVDEKKVDPYWIYYYFKSPLTVAELKNRAMSSGVPHINLAIMREFKIKFPPLPTQRKTAGILSAYDDLIENNTRRIALLEEMAQLIYREWFVHFRFPGHEGVKMVNSELGPIPEGWEVKALSEISKVVDCSHAKKPPQIDDGSNILLHVWNIGTGGKLDLSKKFLVSDADYLLWTKRIEASPGDCVVTKTGRVGAVAQIPSGVHAALGRNIVAMRWSTHPTFLLQYLLSSHKDNEVARLKASGTIMESLHVKAVEKLRIITPTPSIIRGFERVVSPIRNLIEVLLKQNSNLIQTRDLLLPELISGQINLQMIETQKSE
jgi:type I restriction enzyme S subunit